MAKRKLVYEVRDGGAGYFLIAAPSEGEAKQRAKRIGIHVVSIKQHHPRPPEERPCPLPRTDAT